MIFNIHQNKENQRTLLITTHPPIRTVKVFKISKRPIENADFETPMLSRETHIKMERLSSVKCQVDPLGHCFRISLRGIKKMHWRKWKMKSISRVLLKICSFHKNYQNNIICSYAWSEIYYLKLLESKPLLKMLKFKSISEAEYLCP